VTNKNWFDFDDDLGLRHVRVTAAVAEVCALRVPLVLKASKTGNR